LLITQNDSFGKNWGQKFFGKLLQILQNVIEKNFINWRVLLLIEINTRVSDTPCIHTGSLLSMGTVDYFENPL
jgi:hypothetical protein